MEVTEQSSTRLVLFSKTASLTFAYMCGLIAIALGLLLIFSGTHLKNNNPIYAILVGPFGVLAGTSLLLTPAKCMLIIDKNIQQLSIKKFYLFGLVPITRRADLVDLTEFVVRHILAIGLRPAVLMLIFKTHHRKYILSSGNLHFPENSGFLNSDNTDPRNSLEEALIPIISSYINLPAVPKQKVRDTNNVNRRSLYYLLILICGFIFAIAATWVYYHLIHTS